MACYCQFCRFVYSTGTTNCLACGRPTTTDNQPAQNYLNNGYQAWDSIQEDHGPNYDSSSAASGTAHYARTPIIHSADTAAATVGSAAAVSGNSRANSHAGESGGASVLQGEDIFASDNGRNEHTNSSFGTDPAVNPSLERSLENLRRLEREQHRRQMRLAREIRFRNFLTAFAAFPWRAFFRILLLVICIVALVYVWKMRFAILDGVFSFLNILGSRLLSLAVSFLVPILIIIYLLRSLFRGGFK